VQREHVLDRDLPIPPHQRLAQVLRDRIESGELTSRVPRVLSLAQEYEVSHKTSERALHALVDEGLLVAVVGKGFYAKR
jgi:DNA-binding GntR family transcriptional regulator